MQEGQDKNQAGWVYSPNGQPLPPAPAPAAGDDGIMPPPIATVTQAQSAHVMTGPIPQQSFQPDGQPQQYAPQPDMSGQQQGQQTDQQQGEQSGQPIHDQAIVSWTASEYVSRQKNSGWYVWLAAAAILVSAIIFFVTRDILSVVVVAVLCIALGMYAAREPKVRTYVITEHGLQIGERYYPYDTFKSFSVLHEEALSFVSLMPNKRFMPPMAMYYAPDEEDSVLDALADFLPYEERDHDMVDRLSRKIRF